MCSAGATTESEVETQLRQTETLLLPDVDTPPRDLVAFTERRLSRSERIREWRKMRVKRFKSCLKQFFTFLFSQIGIFCLVVGYTLIGGIIFMKLESNKEIEERVKIKENRQKAVNDLWNLVITYNRLYQTNWTAEAQEILTRFQWEVHQAVKDGWSGTEEEGEGQWNFAESLLFAITIITTIGYGHITPKTTWGRIVTMFYALPGIPLMFLCLANIGNLLATTFRYLYVSARNLCLRFRDRNLEVRRARRLREIALRRILRRRRREKDATASTGTIEANHTNHLNNPTLVVTSHETQVVGLDSVDNEELQHEYEIVQQRDALKRQAVANREKPEKVSVPLTLSILLIVIYILAGALLFSLWERENNWDFLIGSYFCFVTLTTIGFGDFVPGTRVDTRAAQEKLIFCALYMIFGLALICMCFDLMQEEVRNKFRWLGKKMGILEDDGELELDETIGSDENLDDLVDQLPPSPPLADMLPTNILPSHQIESTFRNDNY